MKIVYYKVAGGIYLASEDINYSGRVTLDSKDYLYNGLELQSTHHRAWFYLPVEAISEIKRKVAPPRQKVGYCLKDISLESDKIPSKLTIEDVNEYWDDDVDMLVWGNKAYSGMLGLYKPVYKQEDPYYEDVTFSTECLGELNLKKADCSVTDKYLVPVDSRWPHKGDKEIDLTNIVRYSELEQILTPEFLLYTRPCELTSKQSYEIVRQYVKDNIDPKQAEVTSDYNFCFTVKKKIAIKPYVKKWEQKKANGRSYAKPRIKSKNIEYKSVDIFEMTSAEDKYKGYTVLPGFKGESLEDLAENIRLYLEELVFHINAPVKECECCDGTGHVFK